MVLEASPAAASRKRGRDEDDEVDSLFVRSTRDTTELADAEDEDDGLDDSDSEDDDDASDDEDATGPCEYEESSEPLPQCAAYDKDFTQVGEDLMSIPLDVIAIVKENGCESRRAQACRANAKLLTVMPRNKREKIALLGNTEAGMVEFLTLGKQQLMRLQAKVPY